MFYFILYSLLILGIVLEIKHPKLNIRIFIAILLILTVSSAVRYGSGPDYFAYKYHFNILPNNVFNAIFNTVGTDSSHLDIGFRILMSICKMMGMNYEFFIAMISIFTTGMMGYAILKNSRLKTISLLILYANYFLVYMNSALRQGIAMSLFFFAFYQFYQHKKYIKYIVTILIATAFHSSSVICFLVFGVELVFKFNLNIRRNNIILIVVVALFSLINIPGLVMNILNLQFFYSIGDINWLPLLVRVFYVVIIYCFIKLNEDYQSHLFVQKQVYLFFIGTLIYIALSRFSIASRVTDYLMIIEVILIPNLIYYSARKKVLDKLNILGHHFTLPILKYQWIVIYAVVITVLFIKDINSFMYQENYYEHKVFNYEYVTIFNKEGLYSLRDMDPRFPR